MTNEKSTFSGRFKRYANVSTAMTGTAMRFVVNRLLGGELDHEIQAQGLTKALGGLKGPVMKIAQLLATIPDAVPTEYAEEFLHLQANAPSMGWSFVKRRMRGELGPNWPTKFKTFEHTASAAASLGQVHKATSHEGELLACKLQYPDMASTVEADLKQLRMALKIYESASGALKVGEVYEEITDRLREELDYTLEAKHMKLYEHMLSKQKDVRVPRSFPDLSTERLLTMTWLQGNPLKQITDTPQDFRNKIAATMFHVWYLPFYHYGVIHGDPHLGNYTFDDKGVVNLMDFGCIRKFTAPFVEGVIDLYYGLRDQDEARAIHAYETWGFKNLKKEVIEVLNLWAKMLYEPLMEDRVRPIQKGHSGVYGREMAEKVHQELRKVGGIRPPREFVFMDRAAVGIGSVFMHLRAELNWHQEYHALIDGFNAKTLEKRQKKLFEEVEV